MIVVRNVFRLKFGKAREAKELMRQGVTLAKSVGFAPDRLLTDVSGPFYTMVLENVFPSLSAFEESVGKGFANKAWEEWYEKFIPLVEEGHREIFNVVDS